MEIDIMKEYPLLSSWKKRTYWTGFLSVEGNLIRLALNVPHFPTVQGATFKGDETLKKMCRQYKNNIDELIGSDCSVLKFLDSLVKLIRSTWTPVEKTTQEMETTDPQFYSTLLTELDQIGFENVVFVSKNYHELHIKHIDPSGRAHIIKYFFSSQYPRVSLDVIAELPGEHNSFRWPSKILEADKWFSIQLQNFDGFWTEMEYLDKNTRVIDPPNPNRSHIHRRILLEERIIIHMVFDPMKPRMFPEINISGPHKIVDKLDVLVEKQCKHWNDNRNIIENLEAVLDVSCRPESSEDDICCDLELICTVCYMYSFEEEIPDRTCDCGASYHNKCLSDLYANDFLTNVKKCVECPGCGTVSSVRRPRYG